MAKKLIILTGGISSDGISSSWYSICKELKKNDTSEYQIDFLEISEVSDENGVENYRKLGYNIISTPFRQSAPLSYFKSLRRIIRKGEYDTIHVNGSSSFMILEMLAARLEGVKIRIAHSHNTTCNNKLLHKVLFKPFNLLTNLRLACGEEAGKWLFGKSPFTIFHNGIDLEKFRFSAENRKNSRKLLSLDDDTLAFGHVGKFNYQKNHEFLLKVFSEILKIKPKSRLFLFGDGELMEGMKILAESIGIIDKVSFMGVVTNIDYYLSGLDEMLLPSRFEGLPNVVVEWQAAGLPSIISDCITQECKVSDLVKFMSLEDSHISWAKKAIENIPDICNRKYISFKAIDSLKSNGFDISAQTLTLQELYKL